MLAIGDNLPADAGSPRSQTRQAYETIRFDILAGKHAPDRKLKIQDLAADLKVSPGAVREALSRLVPEQLVVSRDQRGFVVAPLSVADLEDLTDMRCEIEEIALRRSVERGDVHWEAALLGAAHRLRSVELVPTPVWRETHAAFHAALVGACGNRRLLTLHAQLYEQSERYRGLSYRVDAERNVPDEHRRIVDLALARDADGLVAVTLAHIRQTTTLIVQGVAEASVPAA